MVKFAYLFGSQARENAGKLSDIDIAVFLLSQIEPFQCRPRLIESISRSVGTPKVDLVVFNLATPLLKHQVIKTGVIVKENKKSRVDFEMESLQRYLDAEHLRNTRMSYMRKHLGEGAYFG